ncbi:MAG TPA: peptidylprolyl isomerase [Vicinamibacterales bacterium]|jgi:peptidyl-prolyl cis-trans isomerase B (cyclophilin B)
MLLAATFLVAWLAALPLQALRPGAPKPQAKAAGSFQTTLSVPQMTGKQAVIDTSMGTVVIDLRPDLAPNHVGYLMKLAGEQVFDGTIVHRVVRDGIIQGGDPLTRDPAKKAQYGTGGLGVLKAEVSAEPFTRGVVAAALRPDQPDSGGSQFFICVSDQPALAGQFSIFGRVSEGLEVARRISELPADDRKEPLDRVTIRSLTIRDAPSPEPVPFAGESPDQLAQHRAVIETTQGTITVAFNPEKAPEHVRNFLQLAQAGVYDGTAFHRVVRGFVEQAGVVASRSAPLSEKQQARVHALQPEFNDIKHVKGIVSMARGDDPASASTSFFIVTGPAPSLDGKYTVFGRVVDGMDVVNRIDAAPVNGEDPVTRIEITKVRIQ